jgi:hypothetical protein
VAQRRLRERGNMSRHQVSDTEIAELAQRINELQRGWTRSREERAIAEAFMSTAGAALTALKNAVDVGEEYHTLHQLIYHDIDDNELRARLIAYFGEQAQPTGQLKILSDIDDTFYCNWIDARYPKKVPYPGVRAFYHQLDLGNDESGQLGDLTFLTARPYDRLGTTDRITHKMLQSYGVTRSTILPGDFLHLLTNQLIAQAKHQRFTEFQPLFPEYEYVFLGDSGQGDVAAGRMMLEHTGVRAVFIHDVVNTAEAERQAHRQDRIFFHDTYVGAAAQAFALGLISRAGLRRVAQSAVEELSNIEFPSPEHKRAMRDHFEHDLEVCNAHLSDEERITLY